MEDIGQSATAFPDDGVAQGLGLFRDGDGFGTSRRDFTSLSVGGNMISSVGSDNGPEGQDGAGPLPMPFDELNADYSLSTVDGLFPTTTVTGSESVDSWIMNGQTLFGDSDHFGGFFINAFGSSSLGPSNLDPPEDPPGKGRSRCSSDGTQSGFFRCDPDENPFMTTSPGAGSNGTDQSALQGSNLPDLNTPIGGNDLSQKMTTAQMAWQWDVTQGIFPPACCAFYFTPPAVDGAFAATSDFVSPSESPNSVSPNEGPDSGPATIPPGGSVWYPAGTGQGQGPTTVPEISQWAMLLIGFAGLALIGRRRLSSKTKPIADA